jgi:bacterioferritin (cytochrome b1)
VQLNELDAARLSGEGEMQGDARVIEELNARLAEELTAINQYFVHAEMCEDWHYGRLAEPSRSARSPR